jgi:hypothetical protein
VSVDNLPSLSVRDTLPLSVLDLKIETFQEKRTSSLQGHDRLGTTIRLDIDETYFVAPREV